MSTLGIGTASFIPAYGLPGAATATSSLVEAVLSAGVRYLDTAAAYGSAESVLGLHSRAIAAFGARLATKVSVVDGARVCAVDDIVAAVRASLQRLARPSVDAVLWHSVSADVVADPAVAEAAARLTGEGLARVVGASTYGEDAAIAALDQPWCGVVQIEYSALNPSVWRVVQGRRRPGQEIVARSVLCKGLLTTRWRDVPDIAGPVAPQLAQLDADVAGWGLSLTEAAIRFVLDTPGVDVTLVGVGSQSELDEAVQAWQRPPLTVAQWQRLAACDFSALDVTHPERWTHV